MWPSPLALLSVSGCTPEYRPEELAPAVVVTPDQVDFGEVALAGSASDVVLIANVGRGVLHVSAVDAAPPFDADATGHDLDPGATLTVTVTFEAATVGAPISTLTVASDDPVHPEVEVSLRASVLAPGLWVTPDHFEFTGDGTPQSDTLFLANDGEGDLVVSSVSLVDDGDGQFSLEDDGLGLRLEPGTAAWFEVTWSGGSDARGTVLVTSNDSELPEVSVPLDATLCPTLYLDGDGDGFGDPEAGAVSCESLPGYVEDGEDCDDADPRTFPGALELRCDGSDQDCDGEPSDNRRADWMLLTLEADGAYEVDPETASLSRVSEIDGLGNPTSVDVRSDGLAVAVDVSPDTLWVLDICGGAATALGATGMGSSGAVGFGPDGELYAIDTTRDALMRLDLDSGAASEVGPLGFGVGNNGIAYDCARDALIGADSGSRSVFTLDLVTGAGGDFVSTDVPFSNVGLEYDPVTGALLASTGTDLYRADPITGASEWVGSFGRSRVNDLFLHPRCE